MPPQFGRIPPTKDSSGNELGPTQKHLLSKYTSRALSRASLAAGLAQRLHISKDYRL